MKMNVLSAESLNHYVLVWKQTIKEASDQKWSVACLINGLDAQRQLYRAEMILHKQKVSP